MKKIALDVAVTPDFYQLEWNNRICIVIDVLRASSTIVTLLEKGCSAVYVVSEEKDALLMHKKTGMILSGERNGLKLPGFKMGNSPCEVYSSDVKDQGVILTTTNGTRVIERVAGCKSLLIGCFLNARACSLSALVLAAEYNCDITIVCAGEKGQFSLDDAYCSGWLVNELYKQAKNKNYSVQLNPSAKEVLDLLVEYENPLSAFKHSWSGQRVLEIGRQDDFEYCANLNIYDSVPIMRRNKDKYFIKMVN